MRPWSHPDARNGDATILHFAIPSPMTAAFGNAPGRASALLPQHHAAALFRAVRSGDCAAGLARPPGTGDARGSRRLAFGVSEYNREELDDLGFGETMVGAAPRGHGAADGRPAVPGAGPVARRRAGQHPVRRTDGAEQENRGPHQAGGALQALRGRVLSFHFRRAATMPFRGTGARSGRWCSEFAMLPERFWFTGPVPDTELAAYYRHAHLYVSLSEHEGFCAPLVEAMAMDVPVLAFAAAAVPGDTRRRRRVVRPEGSRGRGRACGPVDL